MTSFGIGTALPKFDPTAEFVVAAWPKGHTLAGIELRSGERFPKQLLHDPERQLRVLYEQRWIRMAPPIAQPASIVPQPAVAAPTPEPVPSTPSQPSASPPGTKGRSRSSGRARRSKASTSQDLPPVPE